MPQKSSITYSLITHRTHKGNTGHQTPLGGFINTRRDDDMPFTSNEVNTETLKKDKATSATFEGDNSINTPAGGCKTLH